MKGPAGRTQSVVDLLQRLRAGWPGRWEWDGRFDCALSTLTGTDQGKARESLTAGLPSVFTGATLAGAPALLRQICTDAGGLRGGQMVFSAELPTDVVAYCLWWPWGSGANVSARLGAAAADGADLTAAVRSAFDLK
jgi:hypothetical protein